MDFDDHGDLVKEYIDDSLEFIDDLEVLLLQLEKNIGGGPDPAILEEILSQLHTFKGNSGMMGYSGLQKHTHHLEDIYKAFEANSLELNEANMDFLMRSAGAIRKIFSAMTVEKPDEPDMEEEIAGLEQFLSSTQTTESSAQKRELTATGETINPFEKRTDVLKVDFERLDHLLNLMGEMVIYKTRLGSIDNQFREAFGEKGLCLELSDTLEQMGKVSTELHEAIMKVRMLPIKHVFMRFPKLVRDLAKEKGKEINLEFEGEETELDKTVIDEIGEPLMHIIRNAIDHGIETPDVREKSGKPRQGSILIRAYQESSHIIITVEDDGRGIDERRLKEKAESSGLFETGAIGRRGLMELIFMPGFSTAETVTEVSGRGIGMNVVKKSLGRINGSIEVDSEVDIGTKFTIKLPLTLAIISGLMVDVSGEQYAIPLTSVVESIKVRQDEIHRVNGREVVKVRDHILPLVRLSNLFGLPYTRNGNSAYAVIVQSTIGQMGIIVDSLMGQQEIVIKALDDYIGRTKGLAGATILGDGKVVLIIDVHGLMDKSGSQINEEKVLERMDAQ